MVKNKLMLEMDFRQLGPNYSAFKPFNKNKQRIQEFKETGDLTYIYQNETDKAYFQHDMAYRKFKNLPRRTASDNIA